jgi:hypothetical protein
MGEDADDGGNAGDKAGDAMGEDAMGRDKADDSMGEDKAEDSDVDSMNYFPVVIVVCLFKNNQFLSIATRYNNYSISNIRIPLTKKRIVRSFI